MSMNMSNLINDRVQLDLYQLDPVLLLVLDFKATQLDLPAVNCPEVYRYVTDRKRNQQTPELLERLQQALVPCRHQDWLARRQIADCTDIYSIDHAKLSIQDLLDLNIYPDDHILDDHGLRLVDGPVFPDIRNGRLVGVCVRSAASDLAFVADAKYTFSNYGWYLDGYDRYQPDDDVIIVEGVFDAYALRHYGYNAIAVGCCQPQSYQLACLRYKYRNLSVCLDNDLHGYYGAYCVSRLLDIPIWLPELKDISCSFETNRPLKLRPITPTDLYQQLTIEIADYNASIAAGKQPKRPLPYN